MNIQLPNPVAEALARLRQAGYPAHIVGGCVRDSLLGRTPGDWDITTAAHPHQMLEVFKGERCIPTGLAHGTITLLLAGMPLEMTTYRLDGRYSDGRHPDRVEFTSSLEEDLARRDFTINAMAWSPASGLVDPFSGRADIQAGVLRAVGLAERRFQEDALRILRGVRFAAQLGFRLEQGTHSSLLAHRDGLKQVSAERILAEWRKLLEGPYAGSALRSSWPIAQVVLPCLTGLSPAGIEEALAAIERLAPLFILRQTALLFLCDLFPAQADAQLQALRVEKKTRKSILILLAEMGQSLPDSRPQACRLLGRLGADQARNRLQLAEGLVQADPATLAVTHQLLEELIREDACCTIPQLAVNGQDLLALGFPAGAVVGDTLRWLLEQVMEGEVPNERAELLALVREYRAEK